MEWQAILGLAIAAIIILFPAAYVWYLNAGGLYAAIKRARARRAVARGKVETAPAPTATARRAGLARPIAVALAVGAYAAYGVAIGFLAAGFGWQVALALALAIPVLVFPVVFIWYLNIRGIQAAMEKGTERKVAAVHVETRSRTVARLGRSVRVSGAVALGLAVYAAAICVSLAGFGWPGALAVGLAIPVIAIPAAFVWYLNVSGLYQVIRVTRERQKRRAMAVKEALAILRASRTKAGVGQPMEVAAPRKGKG